MKCPKCLLENPPESSFCNRCGSNMSFGQKGMDSSTQTYDVEVKELPTESLFAGRYKIVQKLGTGGMGVVYKAEDTILKRTIAIKVIRPDFTVDKEAKKRFILEAQVAASLDHPNICTVFEISQAEGHDFITMAFIDGESLDKKIELGALEPQEAIDLGIQVASGLNEAQEKGIIHRDIKSANIMLTRKGQAKIMDFGLAKLAEAPGVTKTTRIVGTVAYMSPEQANGQRVDSRSDIWSLGVVLYEMLTGQLPFKKQSTAGMMYSIINENPKPVWSYNNSIPSKLSNIVEKCLEKDPEQRFQSAANLAKDLEAARHDLAAGKRVPKIRLLTHRRRKRLLRIAVPTAVAALAAVLVLSVPGARMTIRGWFAAPKVQPETTVLPEAPSPPAPEPPIVMDISESGELASISLGTNDKTAAGQTGKIYYTKRTGSEETKEDIAQFIVKEVMPEDSKIEITEQKEVIKRGYLIEFDPNPRGALFVDTDPDRASLYLDDQYKGTTDARLILNPGIYNLKIRAKNYQEVTEMINVTSGAVLRKPYRLITLLPQSGTLLIESLPSGAAVFLGNNVRPIGNTPLEKVMPPGPYKGKIRLPSYDELNFEIEVASGKIAYKRYSLVAKNGTLIVDSSPQDADVLLDDSDIPAGRTRLERELPPREYRLRIKKSEFEDQQETITISPAATTERTYVLSPVRQKPPSSYDLIVSTMPTEADVFVNGKPAGKSPCKISLSEPNLILKVAKDNYKPQEKSLMITESPHMETISLEKFGAGLLTISADPPAAVEINGKPIEGRVPPIQTIAVPAGQTSVTFILDEYGVFEKKLAVKDGDKLPVNFRFEQWMLSERGYYSVTSSSRTLPPIALEIDGRRVGDGKVPPLKRRWVEEGGHRINCTLSDKAIEYAVVQLDDFIRPGAKKKIHFLAEREDFVDFKKTDLPEELLKNIESDWIIVKTNTALDIEVNAKTHGGMAARSGFLEESAKKHVLKIKTADPTANYSIDISILKIAAKKLYKINITLGLLKLTKGGL